MSKLIEEYEKHGLERGHGEKLKAQRLFVEFHEAGRDIPKEIIDIVCDICRKDLDDYDSDNDRKAAKERARANSLRIKRNQMSFLRHVHELEAIGIKRGEAQKIAAAEQSYKDGSQQYKRMKDEHLDKDEKYSRYFYDFDSETMHLDLSFRSGTDFTLNMAPIDLENMGSGVFQKTMLSPEAMEPHPDILEREVSPGDPLWNSCQPFIDLLKLEFIKPFEVTVQVAKDNPDEVLAVQTVTGGQHRPLPLAAINRTLLVTILSSRL